MNIAIEIAATLLFAAHLLAVNLAMAGPILCVWLEWRNRRGASQWPEAPRIWTPGTAAPRIEGPRIESPTCAAQANASSLSVERILAVSSLVALPVGLTFGAGMLAILWLTGEKPYFAALAMIPSDRLAFGAGELVFYLAAMFAYQMLCGANKRRRWAGRLLAVAAASNLMLHFPPLFAMMAVLSHRPEMWSRSLDRGLYHSLLVDPEVASRVVHVWLAAVATAGIFVMWLAARRSPAAQSREDAANEPARLQSPEESPLIVGGALWALAASLAQLPVGLWALVALPAGGQAAWSGDFAALALLGAGVAASLALLQQLASAAMGDASRRTANRTPAMLALTVVLMCGASRHMRQAAQPPVVGHETPRAADKIDPPLAPRASGDAP